VVAVKPKEYSDGSGERAGLKSKKRPEMKKYETSQKKKKLTEHGTKKTERHDGPLVARNDKRRERKSFFEANNKPGNNTQTIDRIRSRGLRGGPSHGGFNRHDYRNRNEKGSA